MAKREDSAAGLPGLRMKPMRWLADLINQARGRGGLYQPPQDTIDNLNPAAWPAVLQPIKPIGPAGSEPLARRVWQGQNLLYTPRPDAVLTADQLREIATYDLVRVIIENIKDVICTADMRIQRRQLPGESNADRKKKEHGDDNIVKLQKFWEYPDGERDWPTWARDLLDDMLVIDAASLLIRNTYKGEIGAIEVIDGKEIVRYVDDGGRTPQPPSPAYAQLWEGIPRVDLTTDQLIYKPRNIVRRSTISSHYYGMSPVEQAAKWCRTGALRLDFQEAYYTEGATPGVIQIVPSTVSPAKIAETMAWMNDELAGNIAARHHWRLMQGFAPDGKDQVIFSKEALLSDPFDDLLIRCLCFAFGVSPQRLMRMMNRASADANQEAAEVEGSLPYFMWLKKSVIDFIIQRKMGLVEYECGFNTSADNDILKQAQADKLDLETGVLFRNEVRERRGLDPLNLPEMNEPMITAGNQVVPLAGAIERTQQTMDNQTVTANRPAPTPVKPGESAPKPNGDAKKFKMVYRDSDEEFLFYEVQR